MTIMVSVWVVWVVLALALVGAGFILWKLWAALWAGVWALVYWWRWGRGDACVGLAGDRARQPAADHRV